MAESLGITSPRVPAKGNHDVATYLTFFGELLRRLEGAAAEFEGLIDEASRNLLEVAVQRLFSNLRRHYPAIDLEVITALEAEDDQTMDLGRAIVGVVTAYADRFKRPATGEVPLKRMTRRTTRMARMMVPTTPLEAMLQLRVTQDLSLL